MSPERNEFATRLYSGGEAAKGPYGGQGEKKRDESQSPGTVGNRWRCQSCGALNMSDEALEMHMINHKLYSIMNYLESILAELKAIK